MGGVVMFCPVFGQVLLVGGGAALTTAAIASAFALYADGKCQNAEFLFAGPVHQSVSLGFFLTWGGEGSEHCAHITTARRIGITGNALMDAEELVNCFRHEWLCGKDGA